MRLRRPSLTALRRHVSRDFGGPFQDGSLVVAMQDQPSPFFSSFVSRGGLLLLPSFQRPPLLESNGGGYFTQSSVARGFPPNPCFGCASLPQPKNFSTPLFASISYEFFPPPPRFFDSRRNISKNSRGREEKDARTWRNKGMEGGG